jgi:hypothetical protein
MLPILNTGNKKLELHSTFDLCTTDINDQKQVYKPKRKTRNPEINIENSIDSFPSITNQN